MDADYDLRPLIDNPSRAIEKLQKFVEHHLPDHPALRKGASFVIQAEVRASKGGLRRKNLAKWKFGDDLDLVFETASHAWATLNFEEDYTIIETESQVE